LENIIAFSLGRKYKLNFSFGIFRQFAGSWYQFLKKKFGCHFWNFDRESLLNSNSYKSHHKSFVPKNIFLKAGPMSRRFKIIVNRFSFSS
jgi:hypothetical protein